MNDHSVRRLGRLHPVAAVPLIVIVVLCLSNCGYGGGGGGSVVGNDLLVSPTPKTVPVGTTVVFTTTAEGTATNMPTWDFYGGFAQSGTLTNPSGASITYTAPATPPIYPPGTMYQGGVRVEAISGNFYGSTFFYVTAPTITAGISPTSATVARGTSQQFYGYGVGGNNPAVTWQVNGVAGGSTTYGAINASGTYTAAAALPAGNNAVTVTPVSVLDATKTASAVVTLQ